MISESIEGESLILSPFLFSGVNQGLSPKELSINLKILLFFALWINIGFMVVLSLFVLWTGLVLMRGLLGVGSFFSA